ncbi:MAG: radical SAM protein [Planctomycetes bacterium]|nr:radical SAM protein [Planctomycetota bacterium]
MGTAQPSERAVAGHDPDYYDIPWSQFLWIARGLEQRGIAVEYADLQATPTYDAAAFEQRLSELRPAVLISVANLPSLSFDLELLARWRRLVPGLRVVLLGPAARLDPTRAFSAEAADYVMEANEELVVPELCAEILRDPAGVQPDSCWHRVGAEVVRAPQRQVIRDLDFVDFPAYHLLDVARYESDFFLGRRYRYMTVYTSKGCSYDCCYCPYPFGFGSKILFRSPAKVVDDIERLHREFGVEQICFRDQVFTVRKKHVEAICQQLIERQVPVVWICETRYDLVTPELLQLMARAGCREIHYGLETGDPELFASIGKPGGPRSLARFEEAIAWTKAAGLRVHLHTILGLPGESWKTVRSSLEFLRRTRPHSVQTAILSPYPGTPLFEQLKAQGKLAPVDIEEYGGFQAVQPTEHMSVAELQRAKEYLGWNWDKSAWDKIVIKARRWLGLGAPQS